MGEPTRYDAVVDAHRGALAAVGSVALASAEIEGATADLLIELVDAPLAGAIIYGQPWRSLQSTTLALMKAMEGPLAQEAVALLTRAEKLQERRNDIVHGRWATGARTGNQLFVRYRRNRPPNYTALTDDQIHDLARELNEVAVGIAGITIRWPG